LAGLALFGDQVIAMITVSWAHGINSLTATPGYEFNLALAAMALVIVGIGAGRLSLDAVIGRHLRSTSSSLHGGVEGGLPLPDSDRTQLRTAHLPQ